MSRQLVKKGVTVGLLCFFTTILGAISPKVVDAKGGKMVVANRGPGSISVIDVRNDSVDTIPLPMLSGDATPEPMYVVNTPKKTASGLVTGPITESLCLMEGISKLGL